VGQKKQCKVRHVLISGYFLIVAFLCKARLREHFLLNDEDDHSDDKEVDDSDEDDSDEDDSGEESDEDMNEMKISDLKRRLRERNLDTTGDKAAMIGNFV
jgi:hypothetical protein